MLSKNESKREVKVFLLSFAEASIEVLSQIAKKKSTYCIRSTRLLRFLRVAGLNGSGAFVSPILQLPSTLDHTPVVQ